MTYNPGGYSAKLLDHFDNPRHSGELADADVSALVRNEACGDTLKLTLKLGAGRGLVARFKAAGCPAVIAAGSAAAEMIQGMEPELLGRITASEIEESLGGLPRMKRHAPALAAEALRLAAALLQKNRKSSSPAAEQAAGPGSLERIEE